MLLRRLPELSRPWNTNRLPPLKSGRLIVHAVLLVQVMGYPMPFTWIVFTPIGAVPERETLEFVVPKLLPLLLVMAKAVAVGNCPKANVARALM